MRAFSGILRLSAGEDADPGGRYCPSSAGMAAVRIVEVSPDGIPDVAGLVAACRNAAGLAGRRLAAAGLTASFESTSTRTVAVWIAEPRPAPTPVPSRPWPRRSVPPLGLISLVTTPRRHAIGWLLVHPTARRQGVGRALASAAIDAARGRAAREIWIEVHPDWSGAWAFWESIGFQPA